MIPQRKKTPEEIARLRESMGLAGPVPPLAPDAPSSDAAPAASPPSSQQQIPSPLPVPAPIRTASSPVPEIPVPPPDPRPPVEAKPVRSLRKSERLPLPASHPQSPIHNAQSSLPTHRRTESELNQLRRTQVAHQQPAPAHFLAETAHPALVGLGYLLAFATAFMPFADWRYWFRAPFAVTAALGALSLAIAVFIFLKKKRSVHNACFIAATAFFTLVFSALYYFPHLRNAP